MYTSGDIPLNMLCMICVQWYSQHGCWYVFVVVLLKLYGPQGQALFSLCISSYSILSQNSTDWLFNTENWPLVKTKGKTEGSWILSKRILKLGGKGLDKAMPISQVPQSLLQKMCHSALAAFIRTMSLRLISTRAALKSGQASLQVLAEYAPTWRSASALLTTAS